MDITTEAVRLGLDLAQARAQVASANVAMANVPGAVTRRADFADALAALRQAVRDPEAAAARLASITPQELQAQVRQVPMADESTIDLDDQVAELAVDSAAYRALSEGLTRHFALMQTAVAGK